MLNGLLCIEAPQLVAKLRSQYATAATTTTATTTTNTKTIRTGWQVQWDVAKSTLTITDGENSKWTIPVGEMGGAVQEIYVSGGLESWVKGQMMA